MSYEFGCAKCYDMIISREIIIVRFRYAKSSLLRDAVAGAAHESGRILLLQIQLTLHRGVAVVKDGKDATAATRHLTAQRPILLHTAANILDACQFSGHLKHVHRLTAHSTQIARLQSGDGGGVVGAMGDGGIVHSGISLLGGDALIRLRHHDIAIGQGR